MSETRKCIGYGDKYNTCKNEAKFLQSSPYCSNCAGKSFEDQVARLFKVQGYDVTQNLKLSSTQNDFFAVLGYGWAKNGFLVECKWKFNHNDTVDSKELRVFNSSWEIFNKRGVYGKAHQAYLITNAKFAPETKETAVELGIELYTLNDLISKLINFQPYLDTLIRSYQSSHLNGHYIKLNASTGMSLEKEVENLIKKENAVIVLGDYGVGKTSLCSKLCYKLATQLKAGRQVPLPIYIQLRDYSTAINMESLITNLLINKCGITNANFNTFLELIQMRDTIIFFDGFDEIARRVDYSVKYKVFNEICKFTSESSKIVVTCRFNFFNQKSEFDRIFKSSPLHFEPNTQTVNFSEVEISELTQEQINQYIHSYEKELNRQGISVNNFINILDTTHDLWDLAKRPVLLNIILDTIPKLCLSKPNKINASSLYDQYSRFWLDREDSKGKTLIRSSQKLKFISELAKKMFVKNELAINYNDLPREVKSYFGISSSDDIDHFSHDIRSCSFLNYDESGNYKFIHKSFMEFFVAQEIVSQIIDIRNANDKTKTQRINELLGENIITLEIGYFIKDMADLGKINELDIRSLKLNRLTNLSTIAKKNMISISTKIGKFIHELLSQISDLEGADFSFVNLQNVHFKDFNFNGVNFYGAKMEQVKFINCSFVNSIFRKSQLKQVDFSDENCETSDFSSSFINGCSFSDTSLAFCNFNNTKLSNCDFYRADVTEIKYNNNTEIINCKNLSTAIGLPYDSKWQ